MTRLHPAKARLRALVGLGALFIVVMLASGCANSQAPAPTPDPFAGLADRSDQAFRQGLEAYGQGQYRDALTAFEQARTLSPSADSRIDQMIERTKGAMAPTPTPVPPTPTEVPATPTATPVALSTQTPDNELGQRYFGKVNMATVPGKDMDVPEATQFFFQDQIGLHIDGLKQHLRLPFTLRVFNSDTRQLVAQVNSDEASASPTAVPTAVPTAAASASATPVAQPFHVERFWDSFVWYHKGGEEPGRYHLELYANGVLTNTIDYVVGTVPVPTPTAEVKVAEPAFPSPSVEPTLEEAPLPTPVAVPAPPQPAPVRAPAEPTATAQPTPIPSPTPIPTPATAYSTRVGGVPAGLDIDSDTGRFYLVDSSGVIWTADAPTGLEQPTLGTPINIGARAPIDLTIDQSTGFLYVSARACDANAPYCILALDGRHGGALLRTISLPSAPNQVRVDSELGLLYVTLPGRQALGQVDIRSGQLLRTVEGLPEITALTLDSNSHTLYAAHLGGQVTVVDVPTAQVIARPSLTGPGLASLASARGLVYGVNTATHELAVFEPMSQAVARYPLSQEPAAIAAAEASGAVYVLSSRSDTILQIDPTDGEEIGRVLVGSRSGHAALGSAANLQTLRPRLVLDPANESIFASLPEEGTLAAVPNTQFPVMARAIPYVETPDQPVYASIPGVVWPGGQAGPDQPAPTLRAQAPDPQPTTPETEEEGV
jgi:hypothetical protein